MTVKTMICAGGSRSLTRFPLPRAKMSECLRADGKLDATKAALAFAGAPAIFQPSSKDNDRVYWAVMTWCELMQDAFTRCVNDTNCDLNDHAVTAQDEKIAERIERRHVYVRQTVNPTADGVTVRISVDNPGEVVGQSVVQAGEIAVNFVQMWLRIIRQTTVMKIRIAADGGIVERAAAANRRADRARLRETCGRRHGELCSPADFACPLYNCGRCREVEA